MFGFGNLKTLAAAAVLVMAAGGGASAATATFSSCIGTGYNIANKVSGQTNCTLSNNFSQDFLNPLTVNTTPGFFNVTTWAFLAKDESATAVGAAGSYNFTAAVALALPAGKILDQLMLVFKSGQGTTLVGYLVGTTSGTWATPFTEPPFSFPGNTLSKDVSHISAYYTTKMAAVLVPIPVPAAGLLLLGALGGLAVLRRRRRAA